MNTRPTILHLFGETPFLPEEVNFTIGKAQAAYNLQFSVDCENAGDTNAHWDNYREEQIPADTAVVVKGRGRVWWRLQGNTGHFVVRF